MEGKDNQVEDREKKRIKKGSKDLNIENWGWRESGELREGEPGIKILRIGAEENQVKDK